MVAGGRRAEDVRQGAVPGGGGSPGGGLGIDRLSLSRRVRDAAGPLGPGQHGVGALHHGTGRSPVTCGRPSGTDMACSFPADDSACTASRVSRWPHSNAEPAIAQRYPNGGGTSLLHHGDCPNLAALEYRLSLRLFPERPILPYARSRARPSARGGLMRLVRASTAASRIALIAMSAALAVSGCSISGPGNSGSGQLTVGIVPGIANSPLLVGTQEGVLSDHGLNVVTKTYSSLQTEFQALRSGSVDIAVGDYADFFYEQATGMAALRLVADGYDAAPGVMEVLTRPGSGITTPRGLEHQVV